MYEGRQPFTQSGCPGTVTDELVLKMALELVSEEEEHVALLQKCQECFPRPAKGWDDDLPPHGARVTTTGVYVAFYQFVIYC